ncbi:MAG: response regulator [Deltaproteobacteria bacterium]|nr:response regulator [Deltaproteobacteria bacterium]
MGFGRLIDRLLHRYRDDGVAVRMKARLFLVFCLAVLAILPTIAIYSSFAELQRETAESGFLRFVIMPLALAELGLALVLALLVRGRFVLATQLLLVLLLVTVWAVTLLSHSGPLTRLNNVVFVLGVISATPLVADNRSTILLYGAANLAAFVLVTLHLGQQLGLPASELIDHLADGVVAMAFITLTSYSLFVINRRALEQVERNLVEREQARLELQESRQRLTDIIDFLPDATFVVDVERRVIIWNRAMEKLTGVPAAEILGRSDYARPFHGVDRPLLVDCVLDRSGDTSRRYGAELQATGEVLASEVLAPKLGTDGGHLWCVAKPLRDVQGRLVGVIETIRDVSERHRQERERRRLEEHLVHAQRLESVGRLAGGVAHDFNNLLTTIMGNAGLLMLDLGGDAETAARLRDVAKAAESAAALTRQLLAFSRKQMIEPQPLDLNVHIERSARLATRVIPENVKPVLELGAGIGPILTDPGQIEQIVINLAVNAGDAMPGGGTVTIATRAVRLEASPPNTDPPLSPGDYAVFSVSDTGAGIPPEVREHIFEPFYTTKPVGKGTGLGLASVHGAVVQNGGAIEVESAPGRGTTMTIYFPVIAEADAARRLRSTPQAAGPSRGTETVLLVEDDPRVLEFVERALLRLGYRVLAAADGAAALAAATEPGRRIDLLLTDVILPDMTGPSLAERARDRLGAAKVLFMSGHAENVVVHHGIVDSGVQFIAKPFTAHQLAAKLRDVLDGGD